MTTSRLPDLQKLPISELHVHAEGGILDSKTLIYLAKKNHLPEPSHLVGPAQTIAYEQGNYFDFLKVYDEATRYILTMEDIEEVIFRYLKRCHQEGVIYVELTCSPDHIKQFRQSYRQIWQDLQKTDVALHRSRASQRVEISLCYSKFVDAIVRAIDKANQAFGIESRILMVLLRHNGVAACEETLN